MNFQKNSYQFLQDVGLKLRIRLKRGGSFPIYNYRFSTAIVAVTGSLIKSSGDLDDIEYLKTLRGRSQ